MKKLTFMAVIGAMFCLAVGAQEPAGQIQFVTPVYQFNVPTPTTTPAPATKFTPWVAGAEQIRSSSEYLELKTKVDQQKAEIDALLVVCQQQRAERELIVSAILQAVTAGDYQRVAEIVRQIVVSSLVGAGNGGGQR
jgi:hypothetical protein